MTPSKAMPTRLNSNPETGVPPSLRIGFTAPFKPLEHPRPSGDLVIGTGLYEYLGSRGHRMWTVTRLRTRWIYWKPWLWPKAGGEYRRTLRRLARHRPDIWMTYHSYYKAPDLLGPAVTRRWNIPYVIFQGVYSTKKSRDFRTWPGYVLNTRALMAADHVFTNKRVDHENLIRIIPENRLTYVPPGIRPEVFAFKEKDRNRWRRKWEIGKDPVVLTAAMFRRDVKTQGLRWLINTCGSLFRQGARFHLVVAGDGPERSRLVRLAEEALPGRVIFAGLIPRNEMGGFYSAGDLFAFPGIRESLGMVYLEAQSCGLPVVAFDNGGVPEVVMGDRTGFLVSPYSGTQFSAAMKRLMGNDALRHEMGRQAVNYIRKHHDLNRNYLQMERILLKIAGTRNLRI